MQRNIIYLTIIIFFKILWWLQILVDLYQLWKYYFYTTIVHYFSYFSFNKMEEPILYSFQPYVLKKINYKCYKGLFDRGINTYPAPRSGHRIVCNDSDIFCFGGFNPNLNAGGQQYLFHELWRFDTFTKKWRLVFGSQFEGMPNESASNAVHLKDDMVIASVLSNKK